VRTELAQLGEQQVAKDDALERTTLKSPLRGIVKNIRIGTLGGIVPPGAPILEIVPLTERVLVEARIKPADIGFITTGQAVEVKLSAYDYYTYGGLQGTVEYISPDALGEDRGVGPDTSYYRARIRTDASKLRGKGDRLLPVLPGMTASVEIRTGDRTVMDFLLKPMLKGSEAMRER
jgi:adhesin transport system membrane fusion protein